MALRQRHRGYASGTVAGSLTRRYHGLLIAALAPPLGRTLVVTKLEETVVHDGDAWALTTDRWTSGSVEPTGHRFIERFHLDGTTPVWTYACADVRLEKRVWMEPGANTTYVRYRVLRAGAAVRLMLRALVNHRDHHGVTRGGDWQMRSTRTADGVRVDAFADAVPILLHAAGGRGIHCEATLAPGDTLTVVASTEPDASLNGKAAWARRQAWETERLAAWRAACAWASSAPAWIAHLVLAADQFVVRRALPREPGGMSVIAGYHWFGDWGRDTMIALPGLTLVTGRADVGATILRTFARVIDQGILPNRFPDRGEAPEYNTADATLWYVEAIRAWHAATRDDGLLKEFLPVLEDVLDRHRRGTRHGIRMDAGDGLLHAGEPGMQLTWMDARVGEDVVTPRIGTPVEINALWLNALTSVAGFARALGRPAREWERLAARARRSFDRFWNARLGYCYDVIQGPDGDDDALRPNQIFAVSLTASPLAAARQRAVVDACARHLLTSYGLRSLAPTHPAYCAACTGDVRSRDGAYHQGTVWSWLLGPFALAHYRAYGDRAAARALLEPLAHHLADYGLGSIAEIFDAEPPHAPRGAIAQAWSVAETLRAWDALAD